MYSSLVTTCYNKINMCLFRFGKFLPLPDPPKFCFAEKAIKEVIALLTPPC